MKLHFYKYQGAGNDFIVVDNRQKQAQGLSTAQIAGLCHRRFGIGADGLMLLEAHPQADFQMHYFNADGRLGSLCGNGGRCIVAFARHLGLIGQHTRFLAVDGWHQAVIDESGTWIELEMGAVSAIEALPSGAYVLDTGSPHYVQVVEDLAKVSVVEEGRAIRYSPPFAEKGINVNFMQVRGLGQLALATYERGVEDETYACGTGATAAALCLALRQGLEGQQRIEVQAKGGGLAVSFYKADNQDFSQIFLHGPAKMVFEGSIEI
jgi:diaminopimelate epimerase